MIPMLAARALGDYLPSADLTGENVLAGVVSVVTLFVCFSFIFSIQSDSS